MQRGLFLSLILAFWLGAGLGSASASPSLEEAKQAGLVGERPDGLLGAVGAELPPEVRALIESVNAQRLERYQDIARQNGAPLTDVQAVAGAQLIERTPGGQFILAPSGRWVSR